MNVLTNGAIDKDIKSKRKFSDHHFHIIFRLFNVLANFLLTTIETMRNISKHGIYELPHDLPNDLDLRILVN